MKKTKLGRTGLEVTQLGYGAMELHFGRNGKLKIDDEQAERVLNTALDAGINFVDTSVCYGPSEERIGRFISSRESWLSQPRAGRANEYIPIHIIAVLITPSVHSCRHVFELDSSRHQ